jgi:choline dehydrogenase-like flavoprotein
MSRHYDAIIVGSGFGGSTVALKLAATGLKVLVLERGRWVDRDDSAWDPSAILIDRKYESQTPYEVDERWGRKRVYPDDAVGGKSVFYGAASLRLRREDFRAADRFPAAQLGELPPMDWPFGYETLAPYYDEAERLLGVAGVAGEDPTEPPRGGGYVTAPPPYGTSARRIAEAGRALGFQPFPIPLAINFVGNGARPTCIRCTTCDLFPCKICAKNDLAVTLLPEAQRLGAEIRDRTIATRLVIQNGRVTGVECLNIASGERSTVYGQLVVVSCGAIASAALLLASGLGHAGPSGHLVGRNLMRHCAGIAIAIFPFETNPERQFHKQVAFMDFYFGREGAEPLGPWGMIQALQVPPPEYVRQASPYPPPTGTIGAWTTKFQAFLLCIAEDIPQLANRVELDASVTDPYGMPVARIFHQYTRRDRRARKQLWREAGRVLRKAGALLRLRMPIHTYSHALGTCRMGNDPASSVLDEACGFRGVPNLFVVDSSVFPSSAGVNPSLTIAANGLRVGEHLVAETRRL